MKTLQMQPAIPLLSLFGALASAATQGVFAHYLVGQITEDHANTDITQALALNLDAFALNLGSLGDFATDPDPSKGALAALFNAADANPPFSLFFSFDMAQLGDTNPSDFLAYLSEYQNRSSYYHVDGRPFVSTFDGGTKTFGAADPNSGWQTAFANAGVTPYFVPDFDDATLPNGYPNGIVDAFPYPDGFFSWESAWPASGSTPANVSADTDLGVQSQTKPAGKVYMMPWSSFQFKDLGVGMFYYRIGELNYGQRIEQLISTAPDFVELLTWNDGGEGHYVSNIWPEAVSTTNSTIYTNGFDHTGWQQLVPSVIAALKAGAADTSTLYPAGQFESKPAAGAMWYRPVLTTTSCGSGVPDGAQSALDAINYAVSLPASSTGYTIDVSSGGAVIGTFPAQPGLNINSVQGLIAGTAPRVDVFDNNRAFVTGAIGSAEVQSSADLCNYNYYVIGF